MTTRDDAFDNFRIRAPIGVVAVMREIIHGRAIVSVSFNEGRDGLVTALLAIDADAQELALDIGATPAANERFLAAERFTAVTSVDQIRIEFACTRPRLAAWKGLPAFRAPLPGSVLRLQRRNTYRVKLPSGLPMHCFVPGAAGETKLRLLDLSVGGVALVGAEGQVTEAEGTILRQCRVELPDHAPFIVDLEVRSALPLRDGRTLRQRIGCRFVDLPGATTALIQRVILGIERSLHR